MMSSLSKSLICGGFIALVALAASGQSPLITQSGRPAIRDIEASFSENPPECPPAVPWRMGSGPASVDRPSMLHTEGPLDGVRLGNGEFVHDELDLFIRGRGFDFSWSRRYRSRAPGDLDTAQGVQWTHAYDIRVETSGTGRLTLHDGHGRADEFRLGAGGLYTRHEFFVVGVVHPDTSVTFTFPDQGTWNFRALNAPIAPGCIASIVDRKGNTMTFQYNVAGKLTTVVDTLGRSIGITYTASGRIASVTDFIGRSWTYTYYDGTTPDGSAGDLATVTSPPVTGTPNGNDFPTGKTTTYTYAKGKVHARLDHNLLTITNPKGQTWLVNKYSAGVSPWNMTFDRVLAQRWGDPGDDLQVSYVAVKPGVTRAITNDRRGVVREYTFGARNRLKRCKTLTGFADPTMTTTATVNRPTGKLRSSDPASYVVKYTYNTDSLLVRTVTPELSVMEADYEIDLDPAASRSTAGNLRVRRKLPGPRGADQPMLLESMSYGPHARVTQFVDALGRVTTHLHDGSGNRTHTQTPDPTVVHDYEFNAFGQMTAHILPEDDLGVRRRDEWSYYAGGPQMGYLQSHTTDVANLALVIGFSYNPAGVRTRCTDPEGNEYLAVVNALDQVVRTRSPVMTSAASARYETDYFFDPNDNLVRSDVQNIDEAGTLDPANPYYSTTKTYDILDRPTSVAREVDLATDLLTEWLYDPSGNPELVRGHRAVSGTDPLHVVSTVHDERNLAYRVIRGDGGPDQSTTQYDYDGEGGLVRHRSGLEAGARSTHFEYDGYDRPTAREDAMGNRTENDFDAASRLVMQRLYGELLDVGGGGGNVLLQDVTYGLDLLDRQISRSHAHFNTTTGMPIGVGVSEWTMTYDGLDGLLTSTDPNGNVTTITYDPAHRSNSIADPIFLLTAGRDANGRVISRTEDHFGDPAGPYTTLLAYDEFSRPVQHTNSAGEVSTTAYNSLSNPTLRTDGRGNVTRQSFDGLCQLKVMIQEITDDGTGAGLLIGERVTTYDPALEGIRSVTDDNGYTTTYVCDSLDRLERTIHADGTLLERTYDAHDDQVLLIDQNGTQTVSSHDELGRPTLRSILPGSGVSTQTTTTSIAWDGRGRLVGCSDDNSSLQRTHDSLGALLQETQMLGLMSGSPTSGTIDLEVDAMGLPMTVTYPGGRSLAVSRDARNRAAVISEMGSPVVSNNWVGPRRRLSSRDYGNGTSTGFTYDLALRPTRAETTGVGTLADRTAGWNGSGDLILRGNALPNGTDFDFTIDSLGRLDESLETPPGMAGAVTTYQMDDLLNRLNVQGGDNRGQYIMDSTMPDPADAQMSQYTLTSFDAREYDGAGNLISRLRTGLLVPDEFLWDARDDLVRYQDGVTGDVTEYAYDAMGRRVSKVLDALGVPDETRYFYLGGTLIEEQDAVGTTLATYVWSEFDGEWNDFDVVAMRRAGVDYSLHPDANGNIAAVTDAMGNLVEWYEYGEFGDPRVFDGLGQPLVQSAVSNAFLFWQMYWDVESRLYMGEAIQLDPDVGRSIAGGLDAAFGCGVVRSPPTDWKTVNSGGFRHPDDIGITGLGGDWRVNDQLEWIDWSMASDAQNEVRNIKQLVQMLLNAMMGSLDNDHGFMWNMTKAADAADSTGNHEAAGFWFFDWGDERMKDSDGDGVIDCLDDYPNDPSRSDENDRDGDGVPNEEDDFPDDPSQSITAESEGRWFISIDLLQLERADTLDVSALTWSIEATATASRSDWMRHEFLY